MPTRNPPESFTHPYELADQCRWKMSKQLATTAASDAATAQALQAIIEELEQARACSRHPVQSKALREAMPPEEGEDEVLIECPPAFSRQRFQSEALQDAMQNAFLAALKCGAFKDQNPKWVGLYIRRGNPNDLQVSDLLGYAKVKGYVDGLWRSDPKPKGKGPYPYRGVIDEQAALLIELLRQETAAGAANGDTPPGAGPENTTLNARAMSLLLDHPDWKLKDFANALSLHERTLSKPKYAGFREARNALRRQRGLNITRGSKNKDGHVEAVDE